MAKHKVSVRRKHAKSEDAPKSAAEPKPLSKAEQKKERAARPLSAKVRVRRKRALDGDSLLVSLPGGPQVVVDGVSNNKEAWEKYKKICGIQESDHRPKFSEPPEDLLTNAQGVVVDEKGVQILGSAGGANWDDEFIDEEDDDDVE